MTKAALASGVDHAGVTVYDLAASRAFFTDCLGWPPLGENPDYPAVLVTDRASHVPFDRHKIGLHHLAFHVADLATSRAVHERAAEWPRAIVELAPERNGAGPRIHCMVREPGGNRLEFTCLPQDTALHPYG
ncbi:VOC family protein [Microvirga makkahensis]|uniref:VOC family protein n=1 Tax=Microvirga makkahensis TaxID=1128670 RepID=A0A7X3MPD8_9HYPH|nr:VOC family protein [Microvirga makkahensis]MXQ10786.1 VOC family protein [Microvirga makkahensis]